MQQYQDGDTRVIGSTTYVRQGGVWAPQGDAAPSPQGVRLGSPNPRIAPEVARTQQQLQAGQFDVQRGPAQVQREQIGVTNDQLEAQHKQLVNTQLQQQVSAGPAGSAAESPAQAAGFYMRARHANDGYGQGVAPRGWATQMVADAAPNGLVNTLSSEPRKDADTFAREFVAATLRRESGAAINPEEYTSQYRRYFPVPGDTAEQIDIKAKLRQNALDALRLQAGPLGPQVDQQFSGSHNPGQRDDQAAPVIGGPQASAPPAANGGPPSGPQGGNWRDGPQAGPDLSSAKGGTHDIYDSAVSAAGEAMIRAGKSADDINAYITPKGYKPLTQAQVSAAQAYLKQHPNFRGIFQATRTVPLTGLKGALNTFANSAAGAATGEYINATTGNHLDNLANLAGGDGKLVNLGLETARQDHPYASMGGDLAAGASLYGVGRKVAGRLAGTAAERMAAHLPQWMRGATAGDAAMGGYMGSGANGEQVFDPTSAAEGAAFGAGAGKLARGAINTVGRAVSPTGGRLAPIYAANPEFSPSLGQRVGGVVDKFEQANTAIPFAGAINRTARNVALDQAQTGAFNTALAEIGSKLPPGTVKGTQAQAFMQNEFNKAYSAARSGMRFVPDQQYTQDMTGFMASLKDGTLSNVQASQVATRIKTAVESRIKGRGALDGNSFSQAANDLERTARQWARNPATSAQADALRGYIDIMDGAAARNSPKDAVEALMAAHRGYAKAVVIENAATRNTGGEFTGRQLDSAAKTSSPSVRRRAYLRGDAPMQDYAGAMSQLGDTVPDSGTTARLLATGGLGMFGAAHPLAVAPSALSIGVNGPGLRQALNMLLAPNRPGLAPLRLKIMDRAKLGSLFAAPAAQIGTSR